MEYTTTQIFPFLRKDVERKGPDGPCRMQRIVDFYTGLQRERSKDHLKEVYL